VEKRREERSGDGIEDIGACRRGKRAGYGDEREFKFETGSGNSW